MVCISLTYRHTSGGREYVDGLTWDRKKKYTTLCLIQHYEMIKTYIRCGISWGVQRTVSIVYLIPPFQTEVRPPLIPITVTGCCDINVAGRAPQGFQARTLFDIMKILKYVLWHTVCSNGTQNPQKWGKRVILRVGSPRDRRLRGLSEGRYSHYSTKPHEMIAQPCRRVDV